jgi:hypothetical protein
MEAASLDGRLERAWSHQCFGLLRLLNEFFSFLCINKTLVIFVVLKAYNLPFFLDFSQGFPLSLSFVLIVCPFRS